MPDFSQDPYFNVLPGLEEAPAILLQGQITSCQLIPWGSNYTFAVGLAGEDGQQAMGIYKPQRGEAPLYDFPNGTLYLRERAAYVCCRLLGWDFIPPTIVRDGPHGIGSVQLYVEPDDSTHYFEYHQQRSAELQVIALFDLLANNADRKAGHCLLGKDGKIWGIDHGLTFHPLPKLRTVIWDFCGRPIPSSLLAQLESVRCDGQRAQAVRDALCRFLSAPEVEAFFQRLDALLEHRRYPLLDRYRNTPRPMW